jgi:hypothetical protein
MLLGDNTGGEAVVLLQIRFIMLEFGFKMESVFVTIWFSVCIIEFKFCFNFRYLNIA